ncbi:hypothetical protein GCM10023322_60960 [Rugosimonospora acidiphila]|uniref:Lipoprotein LpqB beta-propeller domain-containing protein n=1 Tax=Rugosimonospora acidiphila TaxID=556531 RepID=A0ABP9SH40_9ACTN
MPDRRQVLRVMMLGTAALAAPAACGLPSGGRPIIDGPAAPAGPGTSNTDLQAPLQQDATDAGGLVTNFLNAVAGKLDVDTDFNKANERAKTYLTDNAQKTWSSGSQVTVVRVVEGPASSAGPAGETFVDVTLQPVGILRNDGTVAPGSNTPVPPPQVAMRFTVVLSDRQPGTYLIDDIGPRSANGSTLTGMLLDSTGLSRWYDPHLVYFWSTDSDRRGLVPDLRYVPKVGQLSQEIQRTEMVNWVLGGPSDLLTSAVLNNLYAGITLVGPNLVPPDPNGLLINLSAAPQGLTPPQIMNQLRWSLRPSYEGYEGTVRLQESSQNVKVDGSSSKYLVNSNLADRPYFEGDDTAYCVVGGVVRQIDNPDRLPDVLRNLDRDNRNVRFAALRTGYPYAALVKTDNSLWIGHTPRDNSDAVFVRSDLNGRNWTRPVFLPAADAVVLVAVDGRLHRVDLGGGQTEIGVGDLAVTAFAVAPDGHRIAMIANGSAWVCALRVDGMSISVGPPRYISSGLTDLTSIAWSQLDRVLIAGRGAVNYQLVEATIDGAMATEWKAAYSYRIVSVVALPNPASVPVASQIDRAMVQTDHNIAYHSTRVSSRSIKLGASAPSPSPSPSHAPAGEPVPSNPFYQD